MKILRLASAALLLTGLTAVPALAETNGYYRWPALHENTLVFGSEGDLWRADLQGTSPAIRLTTHPEVESLPALSPDGQTIALTGRYDGAASVYIMPVSGGAPRQLTFEDRNAEVRGWTPDGRVLFASTSAPGASPLRLKIVDPVSLALEELPLDGADDAAFSDDQQTIYFTRYGLARSNDNAVLYRGGAMAQLWRYTMDSGEEAERLAEDFDAPIRHPMWWNGRIFFLTDKSGGDNIWSMDPSGGDIRQHTGFEAWQLRSPQLHNGRIVYQRGADLYGFNLATETETLLDLRLVSDRDDTRLRYLKEPLEYLETTGMGAEGKAVALTARGRVAVAFPGPRRRVELAIPDNARARSAVLGPDGDWVYVILDQDQFGEAWRYAADGRSAPEQLTFGSDAHIWRLYPSPDGTRLIHDDKRGRLWSIDLETLEGIAIDTNESGNDDSYSGLNWSPAGRYLAYTAEDRRGIRRVIVHDFETGASHVVTRGKYNSFHPAFSHDGAWLYFLSERTFNPTPSNPWRDRTMGTEFDKRTGVFALRLDPEAPFPFRPEDELAGDGEDEDQAPGEEADASIKEEDGGATGSTPGETLDEDDDSTQDTADQDPSNQDPDGEDSESASDEDGESEKVEDTEIVFEGLMDRLWSVPCPSGNYAGLKANEDFLFLLSQDGREWSLKTIAIDPRKPEMETFAAGVGSYDLSADGKTVFFRKGQGAGTTLALVPAGATAPKDLSEKTLRIGDWRLGVVPQGEWRQMLLDAWRMHRAFAYDPDLRGLDWDAIRDKYEPFVDRLGHRSELDDLLARMIAELGILHSQIRSGDQPRDEESGQNAYLGAQYRRAANGLEITLIHEGERDLPDRLGPLMQPHVDVQVGDIITAADGRPVKIEADLIRTLRNKAGQRVRLDLTRDGEPFSAMVEPVSGRAAFFLRYDHWVNDNARTVTRETGDRMGYLHLRAMGGSDLGSFARDFYEHFDKDGLIIDVRGNWGGNIDSFLINTLLRQVWAYWQYPNGGPPFTNMQQTFRGHLVVLIDQNTYSDGETFAAGIKSLGLAPLIGTRTAGAGIWLTSRNRLADQGAARIAEFPQFGLDGRWLVEGRGVAPDIEVINPPYSTAQGGDAQLEAAMRYLADKLAEDPIPPLVPRPLPPVGIPAEAVL